MNRRLVIGPAWVGDMVMAHTLIRLLKANYPDDAIDVLAPAWSQALLERMPEVDKIILSPFNHGELALAARYRMGRALRKEKYVQALILPNSFKSALIPFFSGIAIRTGWAREGRRLIVNDCRKLDKNRYPLMVQRFAALAFEANEALPSLLPYPLLKVDAEGATGLAARLALDLEKPLLALCPGAEFGPSKQWPASHYAELANHKLDQGWQVCLLGSAKDQLQTQTIQKLTKDRCVDVAGKTSLTEAIDLLSMATLVVSNDSGLMHIAAALQRPVVVVYGSTDPRFTPPLGKAVKMVSLSLGCSPCFKRSCRFGHYHCLTQLSPYSVINAVDELLQ